MAYHAVGEGKVVAAGIDTFWRWQLQPDFDDPPLQTLLANAGVGNAWTGLTDQWSEGSFVWFSGPGHILAPTFFAWAAGQPDDQPGDDGDCVILEAAGATWLDQACDEVHAYVCEHEWE